MLYFLAGNGRSTMVLWCHHYRRPVLAWALETSTVCHSSYFTPAREAEYCYQRVCLSVCLFVHLTSSIISGTTWPNCATFSTRMLPVAVSCFSSDGTAIWFVLPVFWMTSCFLVMCTMAQATQVAWQTDRRTDCRTELQRHVPHYAVASYNQTFLQASSLNVLKDYYRLCRSEQMLYTLVSLNEFSHVGFTFVRVYLCVCAFIKDKFKWLYGPSCPVIFH